MKKDINIIYIAGYGRSGSTLLDIILSSSKNIYSVGAMSNLFKWVTESSKCSCGENVNICSFWKDILKKVNIDKKEALETSIISRAVEKRHFFFKKPTEELINKYKTLQYKIFLTIQNKVNTQYILDSSKSSKASFHRPELLHQSGCKVKVIHLTRDGRGVLWSILKKLGSPEWQSRKASPFIRAIRSIIGWNLANYQALRLKGKLDENDYLRLSYEEFMSKPENTIEKLAIFLEIDASELKNILNGGKGLAAEHNIGGNRLRFNKDIRLTPDFAWKQSLPRHYRFMFWIFSWPMMTKLGYTA